MTSWTRLDNEITSSTIDVETFGHEAELRPQKMSEPTGGAALAGITGGEYQDLGPLPFVDSLSPRCELSHRTLRSGTLLFIYPPVYPQNGGSFSRSRRERRLFLGQAPRKSGDCPEKMIFTICIANPTMTIIISIIIQLRRIGGQCRKGVTGIKG